MNSYVLLDDVLRCIDEENELDLSCGRHNLEFQEKIKKLSIQFCCQPDCANKEGFGVIACLTCLRNANIKDRYRKKVDKVKKLYEDMFTVE